MQYGHLKEQYIIQANTDLPKTPHFTDRIICLKPFGAPK